MNQFYSSLIVNGKHFPKVHQVFKPRYNREYFKRLGTNAELLDTHIKARWRGPSLYRDKEELTKFQNNSRQLVKLKENLEKLEKELNGDGAILDEVRTKIGLLEDQIMPITVKIPNRYSKNVPLDEEVVVDRVESNFSASENLTKVLSHTKLSYINSCYSKSVVGPNSYYYHGIAAKLQQGLADFFSSQLSKKDFIPVSGLCLAKSAVIEACNSMDHKNYTTDPCRLLTETPGYTTLHLVEASREALVGFATTIGHRTTNEPLKLMTVGAGYRNGSTWFDSDEKRVTQFETLHSMTICPSIEQYSMKEYHDTRDTIWSVYRSLNLPLRLVHCSLGTMLGNEYDAHRIDVWLPSRNQWLPVSRVSHYLDYITVRAGLKRGHIIDSTVYDSQALIAAITENNQTSTGKFIIPSVIKNHMICLNESDNNDYFRNQTSTNGPGSQYSPINKPPVLNNYEQRRYLVKKNYVFGHSRKAEKKMAGRYNTSLLVPVTAGIGFVICLIDWGEVWIQYMPEMLKRFLYDFVYRPFTRLSNRIIWIDKSKIPPDVPYDSLDLSKHRLTMSERRKEIFYSTTKRAPTETSEE